MPTGLHALRKYSLSTPFNSVFEHAGADEFKYGDEKNIKIKSIILLHVH